MHACIYNAKKERMLLNNLSNKFGDKFTFKVTPVEEIKQAKGGKTPLVVYV